MKNFKRIVSFVMAMVIFASFFCNNIGAVDRRPVHYPYGATFVREFFSDTSAYAFVRIRDWAEEENTTDLIASTYAHVDDYVDLAYYYDAEVYVDLVVYLEDGSQIIVFDSGNVEPDEGTIDALVYGRDCLNYENHSQIVGFETWHEVVIRFRRYNPSGYYESRYENDGDPIIITSFN